MDVATFGRRSTATRRNDFTDGRCEWPPDACEIFGLGKPEAGKSCDCLRGRSNEFPGGLGKCPVARARPGSGCSLRPRRTGKIGLGQYDTYSSACMEQASTSVAGDWR